MKDREAWCVAVHGIAVGHNWVIEQQQQYIDTETDILDLAHVILPATLWLDTLHLQVKKILEIK